MTTVPVLTIGGSHQPIVRSIEQNQPDSVHFLCCGDSGKGAGELNLGIVSGKLLNSEGPRNDLPDLPNIIVFTGLADYCLADAGWSVREKGISHNQGESNGCG